MPAALVHLSYRKFRGLVAESKGEVLPTAGDQATFRAELTETGVCFIPTSTGKPRTPSRAQIEPYLAKFNRHNSTAISAYAGHRNHSYVLTFFKLLLGQRRGAPLLDDGYGDHRRRQLAQVGTDAARPAAAGGPGSDDQPRATDSSRLLAEIVDRLRAV